MYVTSHVCYYPALVLYLGSQSAYCAFTIIYLIYIVTGRKTDFLVSNLCWTIARNCKIICADMLEDIIESDYNDASDHLSVDLEFLTLQETHKKRTFIVSIQCIGTRFEIGPITRFSLFYVFLKLKLTVISTFFLWSHLVVILSVLPNRLWYWQLSFSLTSTTSWCYW